MGAILAPFRGWLIGAAVILVAVLVGYVFWLRHDRAAERDRAEAAIRLQGQLEAERDRLVDLNRANIDALAILKAARSRADAAVVSANDQATAARAQADQLKRRMRDVPVPTDQPFCVRAPRLCAALDDRVRDAGGIPAGGDAPAGRAAGHPG